MADDNEYYSNLLISLYHLMAAVYKVGKID